jgi:zinc transporter
LHERARLLLDEFDAKMMAVTNRRLFTLSILTACLLPPTLVTGLA